jgi:hypothetical protein
LEFVALATARYGPENAVSLPAFHTSMLAFDVTVLEEDDEPPPPQEARTIQNSVAIDIRILNTYLKTHLT